MIRLSLTTDRGRLARNLANRILSRHGRDDDIAHENLAISGAVTVVPLLRGPALTHAHLSDPGQWIVVPGGVRSTFHT